MAFRVHPLGLKSVMMNFKGIREINNDLSIDEPTLLFGNEMLNDETNTQMFLLVEKFIQDTGRFTINGLLYDKVFGCLYCLPFMTDIERLFLLFFFLLIFCVYSATMDNSSLIPYYNIQSELNVNLHWRNNVLLIQ